MARGSVSVSDIPASLSQFILSNFSTLANGDRQCDLCRAKSKIKVYQAGTSPSSLGWHLRKHDVILPNVTELKKQRTSSDQPTIRAALASSADKTKTESVCVANMKMAVAMLRKHPGLPLSLFDSPAFLQSWSSSQGINRYSVRRAVIASDAANFESFTTRVLRHQVVGLQMDGGKNSAGTKQIGEGVVVNGKFYVFDVVPSPDGDLWDAAFYAERLKIFVEKVESEGDCLVAGCTMDNEAALHAGFKELQGIYPHIYGNRCTNHTTELIIGDLQDSGNIDVSAIPVVARVLDATFKLVTHVRNNKACRDALYKAQEERGVQRPKILIKSNNTRKWSSGFLSLSRALELYDDIVFMHSHMRPGDKRTFEDAHFVQNLGPRADLEATARLLFWVFVPEQVLQRDSSSLLHSSHCFESMCEILTENPNVPEAQRISPRLLVNANRAAIRAVVDKHKAKATFYGLYHLAICLWPDTDGRFEHFIAGSTELTSLVDRCWKRWQQKQNSLPSLRPQYRCADTTDDVDMEQKKQMFLSAVQLEFNRHIMPDGADREIIAFKETFKESARTVFNILANSPLIPKRGSINDGRYKVEEYWLRASLYFPHLYVIYKYVNSISATEAGVERIFSKDGFIHSELRNRQDHDISLALLRSAMNHDAFDGVLNGEDVVGPAIHHRDLQYSDDGEPA